MKYLPIQLTSVFLGACIALAACDDSGSNEPGQGAAGSAGSDGAAVAGSTSAAGSTPGSAGAASVDKGTAGASTAGTGGAGRGSMGRGTPPMGNAGAGTAGRGAAGSGSDTETPVGDGSDAPPAASDEDDGADCAVADLPDANSLPANAKLPDPFKKLDGTRMSTKADWRCRRQELKKQAEKYAFGTKPAKPQTVTGSITNTKITVEIMDGGESSSFSANIVLPKSGSAPYASIVVYGGGFGAPLDKAIVDGEGVALINLDPYALGKEGTPRNNKQGAFYTIAGSNSSTGLLLAWAWGVSRIIDVIAQSDGKILKADAVGVTGCSRFGKGAFIAGVFDQRVALTMPIESGSAGVPIWRGIPGEGAQSLSSAYGEQPWFGDAFSAFTGSPTKAPVDTHELVAMIAPRGLFIMDNPHIANLGPKSAHVAALAGAEMYKALGAADNITYHSDVANGAHCAQRPEWAAPLRSNIQRFLKKTGNDPGAIKASTKATGKLSDWSDWTAPTLN